MDVQYLYLKTTKIVKYSYQRLIQNTAIETGQSKLNSHPTYDHKTALSVFDKHVLFI